MDPSLDAMVYMGRVGAWNNPVHTASLRDGAWKGWLWFIRGGHGFLPRGLVGETSQWIVGACGLCNDEAEVWLVWLYGCMAVWLIVASASGEWVASYLARTIERFLFFSQQAKQAREAR